MALVPAQAIITRRTERIEMRSSWSRPGGRAVNAGCTGALIARDHPFSSIASKADGGEAGGVQLEAGNSAALTGGDFGRIPCELGVSGERKRRIIVVWIRRVIIFGEKISRGVGHLLSILLRVASEGAGPA